MAIPHQFVVDGDAAVVSQVIVDSLTEQAFRINDNQSGQISAEHGSKQRTTFLGVGAVGERDRYLSLKITRETDADGHNVISLQPETSSIAGDLKAMSKTKAAYRATYDRIGQALEANPEVSLITP
jgi:hypothetical protein